MGVLIYWDSDPPTSGFMADRISPAKDNGCRGLIRIRETYGIEQMSEKHRSFEQLWKSAVSQLINFQRYKDFKQIHRMALDGELDRSRWIRLNTEIEYETCVKVVEFYRSVWVPWARLNGIDTSDAIWGTQLSSSYDRWIARFVDSSGYPWKPWGEFYDKVIAVHVAGR